MSATRIEAFDSTLQTTYGWLHDLQQRLDWREPQKAYHALRAVLHALRDRLPVENAAHFSAQLPMLVRGFYYEGYNPTGKPVKERHLTSFLTHVREAFQGDSSVDPEQVARAVFSVLSKHMTAGEIDSVRRVLPEELRCLCA